MQELVSFMKKETSESHVYFKSKNLNIDYMLTLKERKVKELGTKKLELSMHKIRICKGLSPLNNFEIVRCVGTGGFSRVYLCRAYGRLMALKAINKQFIV